MKLYTIHYPDDKEVKFKAFTYPAGESQVRLVPEELSKIKEADEVHVTARIKSGEEVIQLALLMNALDSQSPKEVILILPYLPYARADRRFLNGDCFGLQTFAQIVNSMPQEKVVTFDVHSKYSAEYINNLQNIDPIETIEHILTLYRPKDSVVILPDAGSVSRLSHLRKEGRKILVCDKKRDPETGLFLGFTAPTAEEFGESKNAIIVDDLCDAGGTFIGIAKLLPKDLNLSLYVSHGIFSKGVGELGKYFKKIYTTDSFKSAADGDVGYKDVVTTLPIEGYLRGKLLPVADVWANCGK